METQYPEEARPYSKAHNRHDSGKANPLSLGISLGMLWGLVLGVALGKLALGLAIGISLGVAFSAFIKKKRDAALHGRDAGKESEE